MMLLRSVQFVCVWLLYLLHNSSVINTKVDNILLEEIVGLNGTEVPTLANLRYFTPNPFSESEKWTFINVHF